MKQLLENMVRVKFIQPSGNIFRVCWYDLVVDERRRAIGKDCASWQSSEVGNKVESEVMTIKRAV